MAAGIHMMHRERTSRRPLRITTIGPTSVGKTTMLQQFAGGDSAGEASPTVGIEFSVRRFDDPEFGACDVEIWDTSGQERYYALSHTYIRCAAGLLIVYDAHVDEQVGHTSVLEWYRRVQECRRDFSSVPIAVAGNKLDLRTSAAGDGSTSVERWCSGLGIPHFFTSGLDGRNCSLPFDDLVHRAQALRFAQQLESEAQARRRPVLLRPATPESPSDRWRCPCA